MTKCFTSICIKQHTAEHTLPALLSSTFLQTLPELGTNKTGSNIVPKHPGKHETQPPQGEKKKSTVSIQTILVLFVLA